MKGKQVFFDEAIKVPLLTAHPSGNPPVGFVYLYGLTTDKLVYQKDDAGVITVLSGGAGGGGGITEQQILARVFVN